MRLHTYTRHVPGEDGGERRVGWDGVAERREGEGRRYAEKLQHGTSGVFQGQFHLLWTTLACPVWRSFNKQLFTNGILLFLHTQYNYDIYSAIKII